MALRLYYGFCIALFLLLCGLAALVMAGEYEVAVSWEYADPPADLAGFKIYGEEGQILEVQDPAARTWSGTLPLDDGENTVSMTAVDQAGQESERSEPVSFNPPPRGRPGITLQLVIAR